MTKAQFVEHLIEALGKFQSAVSDYNARVTDAQDTADMRSSFYLAIAYSSLKDEEIFLYEEENPVASAIIQLRHRTEQSPLLLGDLRIIEKAWEYYEGEMRKKEYLERSPSQIA